RPQNLAEVCVSENWTSWNGDLESVKGPHFTFPGSDVAGKFPTPRVLLTVWQKSQETPLAATGLNFDPSIGGISPDMTPTGTWHPKQKLSLRPLVSSLASFAAD
ncbi:MAG: hypothetical protein WBH75_00920, partial [Thermoanaerobaculia bacterium]